jgi:hypothetical protein
MRRDLIDEYKLLITGTSTLGSIAVTVSRSLVSEARPEP